MAFVGSVVNGGSMPTVNGKVYLVNPVTMTGSETEGAATVAVVDTSRTVPIVVIGSRVPSVGDLLPVYDVANRWVAESGTDRVPCVPCSLPRTDLTVSWTNTGTIGNGSTSMARSGSTWASACVDQLRFTLACTSSLIQFGVSIFADGDCTGEPTQACVSPGLNPLSLVLDYWTCSPFHLHYTVTSASCPELWYRKYTGFAIDE